MLREASLALGPATVVDLSHEVFPKKHWGTMAESETFAHLEHLADAGEAEAWSEAGRLFYRVAPKGFVDQRVVDAIGKLYAPHAIALTEAEHKAFAGNAIALSHDVA